MMDDEAKRGAVHDVVGAGKTADEIHALVRPWGKADAQKILTTVMGDYVVEFNRVIGASREQPYGVDASQFMAQYALLWSVKQAL